MPDSQPLVTLKEILPTEQGAISSITFAPVQSSIDGCKLYLLREQQVHIILHSYYFKINVKIILFVLFKEIFVIEPVDSVSNIETSLERINESTKPLPSAYSAMIAEKEANLVVKQNIQPAQFSTKAPASDVSFFISLFL